MWPGPLVAAERLARETMSKRMRMRSAPHRSIEIGAHGNEASVVTRPEAGDRLPSLEDEIRLRAYYRYLERETESGDEVSDWLEAESDVLGRHATGVDADERVSEAR